MSAGGLRLPLWIAWTLLACALGAAGFLWMLQTKTESSRDAAVDDLALCSASLSRLKLQAAATSEKLQKCLLQVKSLEEQRDGLYENLSVERAMPRGSLGEIFLRYEKFASSLRFSVTVQMEYQVRWKLEQELDDDSGDGTASDASHIVKSAMGKRSLLQGVYLGRRSNFAFGLVAIADSDVCLRVPSSQKAFSPPAAKVIKRKMWLDKEVRYVPDEPHIRRLLHVSIVLMGQGIHASSIAAKVVRVWREPKKGFFVLVIGSNEAPDGIDPGPAYISEQAWLGSLDELGLFPMTSANGGLVLYKERLSVAYTKDRREHPELNRSVDYYRNGWLRSDWDTIPGRLELLFAPLASGKQDSLVPKIHSLVFPMAERKAWWLPFWSLRESLLAPGKSDPSILPAIDLESQLLPLVLSSLPTTQGGQWDESAFQSALYDLLKRKPAIK